MSRDLPVDHRVARALQRLAERFAGRHAGGAKTRPGDRGRRALPNREPLAEQSPRLLACHRHGDEDDGALRVLEQTHDLAGTDVVLGENR